jgi:DNA modification methylase
MHESALVWSIGNPEMPENALLSVIRVQVGHHNAHLRHPHEKPIAFWKNALNLPGQSIFDPFLGSGTSLVAAKNLGRHAVGIEIEERYAEISATRLQQEVLPLHAATPIVNQDAFLFTEGKE